MTGMTDEQAKELVPVTICGIETKLPRVYVAWVEAVIAIPRSYGPGTEQPRIEAQAKADALRDQMRRVAGFAD